MWYAPVWGETSLELEAAARLVISTVPVLHAIPMDRNALGRSADLRTGHMGYASAGTGLRAFGHMGYPIELVRLGGGCAVGAA